MLFYFGDRPSDFYGIAVQPVANANAHATGFVSAKNPANYSQGVTFSSNQWVFLTARFALNQSGANGYLQTLQYFTNGALTAQFDLTPAAVPGKPTLPRLTIGAIGQTESPFIGDMAHVQVPTRVL